MANLDARRNHLPRMKKKGFLSLSFFLHSFILLIFSHKQGFKSIFTPYHRHNLDLEPFFRQLGVPSVARLTRILIRLFTSRGAQKKKALTSHSCQKRWNGCKKLSFSLTLSSLSSSSFDEFLHHDLVSEQSGVQYLQNGQNRQNKLN